MIESRVGKPGIRWTAHFAYAAGVTGILANLFLIAFYALQASQPENGTWLGSANDLVGSVSTALMIPVALALSTLLPDRRRAWITRVVGLSAMAVLVVGGSLLVFGVLAFEVQAPIAVGAGMFLFLWLLLINRWLRLSGCSPTAGGTVRGGHGGVRTGRWRARRVRVLAPLDVVAAVDPLRRRWDSWNDRHARHPLLVSVPWTISAKVIAMSANSRLRRHRLQRPVT